MKRIFAPMTLILLALSIFALAGCGGAATQAPPTVAPTSVGATTEVTGKPTVPPGEYANPVLDRDFPDPDTLKADGWYYAYATNGNGRNIQVARSQDLVKWEVLTDALPKLPAWAAQDFGWAWAPEVWQPEDGGPFVMYHVARYAINKAGGTQCIGAATSETPEGPFQPVGDKPMICQVDAGGSIDPATFVDDDGKTYLLWKNDGNSGGGQTFLYIQPVSADGLTLEGEPTKLLTADTVWEGVLVEAPTLWKRDGKYYLFYSANAYNTPRYAVGYAVADHVLGPYEKVAGPFLKTNVGAGIVGPGGQDIVVGPDGDTWFLFHSWSATGYRYMDLVPLTWQDDRPALGELSRDPQPAP